MITGCADDVIRTWNWQTGELKRGVPYPYASTFDVTSDRRWLVALGITALVAADWRNGAPISPLWRIQDRFQWGLTIPAGDRRAIVGGFYGTVVGYDLEKMVTPNTASADELTRLAELAAGRRIMSDGRVVPLSTTEWTDRWEQLRPIQDAASRPPVMTPAPELPGR